MLVVCRSLNGYPVYKSLLLWCHKRSHLFFHVNNRLIIYRLCFFNSERKSHKLSFIFIQDTNNLNGYFKLLLPVLFYLPYSLIYLIHFSCLIFSVFKLYFSAKKKTFTRFPPVNQTTSWGAALRKFLSELCSVWAESCTLLQCSSALSLRRLLNGAPPSWAQTFSKGLKQ